MKKAHKITSQQTTILCLILVIILFPIIAPFKQTVCASNSVLEVSKELNSSVIEELEQIDFSSLETIINNFNTSKGNIFSLKNLKAKVYSIISGESAINYSSVVGSIFSLLTDLVIRYLPLLSVIVAIGVVSNMLEGFKSKFNEKSTSNLIHVVCFFAVVVLIVGVVTGLSTSASSCITQMVEQMNILFPILLTLMTGMGATASVGMFQPIIAIMSTYIADLFTYFIVPLFVISFVFNIISNISDNIKLDKFNSFISSLFKWALGLVFTVFFAVISIQGITAGSFDGLSIRTTKYTIKSYVPLMGGYLSDGMDLILASTMLIKNSIGLVGVLIIISNIISPILEIAILSLFLKLVGAILQPMGNTKISNFLT
ncbi:MAG: stage III sporulation protein AE, partial [Clostridia bacterium]|nr:stage III sporulation protein AE [Clostridia bacterium]